MFIKSKLTPLQLTGTLPDLSFPLWRWPPKFAQSHRDPDVVDMRARGLQAYLASALAASTSRGSMPLPLSRFLRLDPDEDIDDGEEEGSAVSNSAAFVSLRKMRNHLRSLRQLQQQLESTLVGAAQDDEPGYEDMEGPATLASRLGTPIAQLDSLLAALNVQLSAQGNAEPIPEEEEVPSDPTLTAPTVMGRARSFLTRAFSGSSQSGVDEWPEASTSMYHTALESTAPAAVQRSHSGGKARVVDVPMPSFLGHDDAGL